jgi:predicted dithiol-disulfide oxidoreductase (DUF899 family)
MEYVERKLLVRPIGEQLDELAALKRSSVPSAVSRAPLAKLQAYKRRMGWTFPGVRARQ